MPRHRKRRLSLQSQELAIDGTVLEVASLRRCLIALCSNVQGVCSGGNDLGCPACMKEPVLAGDALSKYCAHSAEARSCFMQAGGLFMIQAALRSPHEANVAAALVVAAALAAAEDGAAMMAAPRRGQAGAGAHLCGGGGRGRRHRRDLPQDVPLPG
mmetsp:Transcript_27644/g.65647  ORF Transcript_27644/g.65647 Transcript_27644/m.65647 type:complete len:157 (+) Transcript_27644:127-597(+)